MTLARWVIVGLISLYVIYGVLMVVMHPRFIYPFQDRPFAGQGYETIQISDASQAIVYKGTSGSPVIVYFMGNAGALEFFRPMLDHHKAAGRSIVAMTYPGGGGVPGRTTETGLKQSAMKLMAAIPDLVPDGPVIVQGYSLGTGIALHVAARHKVDAVVLSAPYDALCRLMARASVLPACLLPVQRWQSAKDAPNVSAPTLVLHGTADTLIPISEGARLAARLPMHEFIPVEGAGHNNLFGQPGFMEKIDEFIDAHSL